ncbi:uncharacterized protein EHS24_000867 [Apiotrichum porosum]|uniref:Uncharacterized protein n=1 Tax=Apiotrichum porosum TaxID=105984 RepID=A0A427YB10_9TREE|nr:uncharacterized protein EHS24_000867 [Apiotrichum porosum]RSH88330.1 hypothetical protein EHS24_000867 [Apiotrichum porosum]
MSDARDPMVLGGEYDFCRRKLRRWEGPNEADKAAVHVAFRFALAILDCSTGRLAGSHVLAGRTDGEVIRAMGQVLSTEPMYIWVTRSLDRSQYGYDVCQVRDTPSEHKQLLDNSIFIDPWLVERLSAATQNRALSPHHYARHLVFTGIAVAHLLLHLRRHAVAPLVPPKTILDNTPPITTNLEYVEPHHDENDFVFEALLFGGNVTGQWVREASPIRQPLPLAADEPNCQEGGMVLPAAISRPPTPTINPKPFDCVSVTKADGETHPIPDSWLAELVQAAFESGSITMEEFPPPTGDPLSRDEATSYPDKGDPQQHRCSRVFY